MKYLVEPRGGLLVLRVPEGATDDTLDGDSLYEQVEALFDARPGPWLVLHDLRGTPRSSMRRRRFAKWVKEHDGLIKRHIHAYALVAGSALLEGMITAVLWVVDPPIGWKAFSDPLEAEQWLRNLPPP